ncbi:sterol desaturase family protein [Tsukamurella sp. 8F]|uniref:sterol desaturase family protein n=1 Tax=unclassified Tsukamurella TaxID=2633480 RepID=UPI0023B92382|nr:MULTISPECIES: sterol desaturase family protein [unclassified Tsukamurella]MDF0529977.1 sterol desaturase family protein [Tsukamurella sp. 8J]MDF0587251.1 sterol desaturase family protein [Tsukamurella sp. 8F]
MIKTTLRYSYAPLMLLGINGLAIWLASAGVHKIALLGVVLVAVAISFAVERAIPYRPEWNHSHEDSLRDAIHVFVNESLILLSVAAIPVLAALRGRHTWWPADQPFWVQVLISVLAADMGITLVHMASHRFAWMWRLHAVHHSVTRCYGLNGLMKHPVHQTLEMLGGVAPLIVVGIPVPVASALAVCVAVQLLMQHSNADYRVGLLGRVLALNAGHRFHHIKFAGAGDVNFGLFTLIWDHLAGTYDFDPDRRFTTGDLGMAAKPDYPTGYIAQMKTPFTARGACGPIQQLPRRRLGERSVRRERPGPTVG